MARGAHSGDALADIPKNISAELILRAMQGLLEARWQKKITRGSFLKVWGRLRRLLALTPEYVRWRWYVKDRAGGACESCAEPGHHAHHIVPVAHEPALALDLSNGKFLCRKCHRSEHRHIRSQGPPPRKGSSNPPSTARPLPARPRPTPHSPRR